MSETIDLNEAAAALEHAQGVLDAGIARLASDGIDDNQVLAYDVAHAAAGVMAARGLLSYGARGQDEAKVTAAFAADVIGDLAAKLFGREHEWGVSPGALDGARDEFKKIARDFEIKVHAFDARTAPLDVTDGRITLPESPQGEQTAIGAAIEDVLRAEAGKRLLGVVLLGEAVVAGDHHPLDGGPRAGDRGQQP